MDCPNCGTYNPENRTTCWRCDKELPKPKPQKQRNPQSARNWLYIVAVIFLVITALQMCGVPLPFGPQQESSQQPSGQVAPAPEFASVTWTTW
ncbi:MAG: hypothetical protein ACYC5M_15590 [Anaerolineae bacterium]